MEQLGLLLEDVRIDVLLDLSDEPLVQVRDVVQVLDGPLVLLSSQDVALNNLCKLLRKRGKVVGEKLDREDHDQLRGDQFVVVSR